MISPGLRFKCYICVMVENYKSWRLSFNIQRPLPKPYKIHRSNWNQKVRVPDPKHHLLGLSTVLKWGSPLFSLGGGSIQSSGTLVFLLILGQRCHQLGEEHNFPSHNQLNKSHTLPQEDTLVLKFTHGRTHQISSHSNFCHLQFFHFLYNIYLIYDIIAWWGMSHVVGES